MVRRKRRRHTSPFDGDIDWNQLNKNFGKAKNLVKTKRQKEDLGFVIGAIVVVMIIMAFGMPPFRTLLLDWIKDNPIEFMGKIFIVIFMSILLLIFFNPTFFRKLLRIFSPQRYNKELEDILDALRSYSTDRVIRDEREFETAIFEYLRTKFPNKKIKHQHYTKFGKKIDIMIDNGIGLELKVADSAGNLDSLFAQIEFYKENCENLVLVIVDLKLVTYLDEYVKRFKEKGVSVVIIDKIRFSRPNHRR